MLGIRSRSWASRSQGSSLRNRIAVSNVAPPHISSENSLRAEPRVGVGDAEHVAGPHARGQQRLVGVAERRVGEEQRLLLADPAGEASGPELLEAAAASPRAAAADAVVRGGSRLGRGDVVRRAASTPGEAVDDDLGGVGQEPASPGPAGPGTGTARASRR